MRQKNGQGPRSVFKYPSNMEFFATFQASYTQIEKGIIVHGPGVSKTFGRNIEAKHSIRSIDGLMTQLEERHLSRQDIRPSPKQYLKEIDVAKFEKVASIDTNGGGSSCAWGLLLIQLQWQLLLRRRQQNPWLLVKALAPKDDLAPASKMEILATQSVEPSSTILASLGRQSLS